MSDPEIPLPKSRADRTRVTPPETLKNLKDLLGPLNTEVIEAPTLSEAHFKLGQQNSKRIQATLLERTTQMGPEKTQELLELSQKILAHMQKRAAELSSTHPATSSAILDYIDCLQAWSQGENLGDSSLEKALLLQNDTAGCQTIMIRGDNGQIIFGHSEEDDTPDRVRHNDWTQFKFTTNGQSQTLTAYTSYKDLLPGPAFSLTPNGIMASDAIFVDTPDKVGFLGNTVSWILWQLGSEKDSQQIISQLLPSPSGYAINQAYWDQATGTVTGTIIEFAGSEISLKTVGNKPGDYSFHTNAIDTTNPQLKSLEDLEKNDIRFFNRRKNTLEDILLAIKHRPYHDFPNPIESLKKIFGFRGSETAKQKRQAIASDWSRALVFSAVNPDGSVNYDIESGPVLKGRIFDDLAKSDNITP
jgi:hypothetical protein